jgi:hypothetical protein
LFIYLPKIAIILYEVANVKTSKKLVSLFLILAILMSALSLSAFAADVSDEDGTEQSVASGTPYFASWTITPDVYAAGAPWFLRIYTVGGNAWTTPISGLSGGVFFYDDDIIGHGVIPWYVAMVG